MNKANPQGAVDAAAPEETRPPRESDGPDGSAGYDKGDDPYAEELIEGHEYDGIKEYNNPIPPWLSLIFGGSIIYGVLYMAGIGLGYIDSYEEDLAQGQEEIVALRTQAQSNQKEVDQAMLASAVEEDEAVQTGQEAYMQNCASCHGDKGQGMVGPNLADAHWLHGGDLKSIYETVTKGVPANGMPPWESSISQEERVAVTAFIRSLQGTNPPNAKEAEGEKFTPDQ